MRAHLLLALALAVPACKAKAKDAAKTDDPPEVAKTSAPDAGKAAPTAALDAAAAAPADGGTAVAVVVDAGPPAADAMAAKPAEAGAFYLVSYGPLESALVIEELDKKPAGEGGEFEFYPQEDDGRLSFQVARRFTTPEPAHQALVGQRLALWGLDGRKCAGTVKEIVAVGTGTMWGGGGDLHDRQKEPKDTPDIVAKLVEEANAWYAAAVLTDLDVACKDELFAIAADAKPKLLKVKAAKDWEDDAKAAYDKAGRVQDAHAKHDLEGVAGVKMISVRKIVATTGPSLALVYASLNEHRTIGVYSVPGPTFEGAKYLGSVDAETPSEVVGGDFDGDGLVDVLVEHLTGVAVVRGNGEGQTIVDGEIDSPMD